MDLGLTGKRALVLGATRGLGHGIAEALAREGAVVAITGRRLEQARAVAGEIATVSGATTHGFAFDALEAESAASLIASVTEALGAVDIIVLNSGGPPPGPVEAVDAAVWSSQFQAQFLSFVSVAKAFLPGMRQQRWGRVLVSSSSGVVQPIAGLGISNSLRSALLGWAKTLANEVAPDGVTVNTIIPGRIQTARVDEIDAATASRTGQTFDQVRTASLASIPMGRFGTPREYGGVAAFLLSERASYITGSTIRVDGGMIRAV